MSAGTAQATLSHDPAHGALVGDFRAWFAAVAQRMRAERATRAAQRRAARVAAAERDASRLYWRD